MSFAEQPFYATAYGIMEATIEVQTDSWPAVIFQTTCLTVWEATFFVWAEATELSVEQNKKKGLLEIP